MYVKQPECAHRSLGVHITMYTQYANRRIKKSSYEINKRRPIRCQDIQCYFILRVLGCCAITHTCVTPPDLAARINIVFYPHSLSIE